MDATNGKKVLALLSHEKGANFTHILKIYQSIPRILGELGIFVCLDGRERDGEQVEVGDI